jgi:integrase/recombinase XerC
MPGQERAVAGANQSGMRFDAAIAEYLAWVEAAGRSPATVANYSTYLSDWARASFPDADPPVAEIDAEAIQSYIAALRSRGLMDSSLQTALTPLRSFLRWCERRRLIERSPMDSVLLPSLASSVDDDYRFLDEDELDQLLDAARAGWTEDEAAGVPADTRTPARRAEDHLLCLLLGLAGLRVAEVCALDEGDVDEDDVLVRSGKGKRRRRVPTDPEVWEAYQRHTPPRPHLFGMARDPRRRITRNSVEVRVSRLARYAGLDGQVTPHTLRHSFATNTWRATRELVPLRDLLGHASTATTNRYTHSRAEERRAVLAEARVARQRRRDQRDRSLPWRTSSVLPAALSETEPDGGRSARP